MRIAADNPQENCKVVKDQDDGHSCLSFSVNTARQECLAS